MKNIDKRVKKIISNLFHVNIQKIKDSDSFIENFEADSLDIIELIMLIEEEFKIEISEKDSKKFKNVKDIIFFLKNINL